MSEQKSENEKPKADEPKEEEKVPDTHQKQKSNADTEKHYPSLPVQIRKDGQEVDIKSHK